MTGPLLSLSILAPSCLIYLVCSWNWRTNPFSNVSIWEVAFWQSRESFFIELIALIRSCCGKSSGNGIVCLGLLAALFYFFWEGAGGAGAGGGGVTGFGVSLATFFSSRLRVLITEIGCSTWTGGSLFTAGFLDYSFSFAMSSTFDSMIFVIYFESCLYSSPIFLLYFSILSPPAYWTNSECYPFFFRSWILSYFL